MIAFPLPNGAVPFGIGTILAVIALVYVLSPLLRTTPVSDPEAIMDNNAATSAHDEFAIDSDPVEAAIRRARANQKSCPECGPRVEPDANYCSNCGKYLPGECPHCDAHVSESSAYFCANCGVQLAAP